MRMGLTRFGRRSGRAVRRDALISRIHMGQARLSSRIRSSLFGGTFM